MFAIETGRGGRAFVVCVAAVAAATPAAAEPQPSGKEWCKKYPGSAKIADLDAGFASKVTEFIDAAKAAGAEVAISSTFRPKEQAYLMHWLWLIARKDQDAATVPKLAGVEIEWSHGSKAASKAKAQEMVEAFGIDPGLEVAPALTSRHIEGKAIDMNVTWSGTLKIKDKEGKTVTVTSTPRDSTNADLIDVAKSYGVIHFTAVAKDKRHWSTDGK